MYGLQADASVADVRGENTCFSGLAGFNCQRIVNSLGTITGRLGSAWDRSLAYVRGGRSWIGTTYNLNAVTIISLPGSGSTGVAAWGWTAGGGVEYALADDWSTLLEYDRVEVPRAAVPFPTVPVINTQNISVRQSINVIKLGVNYRFDGRSIIESN